MNIEESIEKGGKGSGIYSVEDPQTGDILDSGEAKKKEAPPGFHRHPNYPTGDRFGRIHPENQEPILGSPHAKFHARLDWEKKHPKMMGKKKRQERLETQRKIKEFKQKKEELAHEINRLAATREEGRPTPYGKPRAGTEEKLPSKKRKKGTFTTQLPPKGRPGTTWADASYTGTGHTVPVGKETLPPEEERKIKQKLQTYLKWMNKITTLSPIDRMIWFERKQDELRAEYYGIPKRLWWEDLRVSRKYDKLEDKAQYKRKNLIAEVEKDPLEEATYTLTIHNLKSNTGRQQKFKTFAGAQEVAGMAFFEQESKRNKEIKKPASLTQYREEPAKERDYPARWKLEEDDEDVEEEWKAKIRDVFESQQPKKKQKKKIRKESVLKDMDDFILKSLWWEELKVNKKIFGQGDSAYYTKDRIEAKITPAINGGYDILYKTGTGKTGGHTFKTFTEAQDSVERLFRGQEKQKDVAKENIRKEFATMSMISVPTFGGYQKTREVKKQQILKSIEEALDKSLNEITFKKPTTPLQRKILGKIEHYLDLQQEDETKSPEEEIADLEERKTVFVKDVGEVILRKSYDSNNLEVIKFLIGYRDLAFQGLKYPNNELDRLYKMSISLSQKEPNDITTRLDKVIFIDSVAHNMHQEKDIDGKSKFLILDELAECAKSKGEINRDERLIALASDSDVKDKLKKLNSGLSIMQKQQTRKEIIQLKQEFKVNGIESLSNKEMCQLNRYYSERYFELDNKAKEELKIIEAEIIKRKLSKVEILKYTFWDSFIIGGYGSVEIRDSEGHKITLEALRKTIPDFMFDPKFRNAMVFHSDVQVAVILPIFVNHNGESFTTHIDDIGFYCVVELRDDIDIAQKVKEEIEKGNLRSFSLAGTAKKKESVGNGQFDIYDLEEYEITICEQGVNSQAKFEILQSENKAVL